MLVRDVMTTNVVTVPSSTSVSDAKRIMEVHRFRRLPVVDRGKLVGIVTERGLEGVSPSKATSLSVWELNYLLTKTTVKEIMTKDPVTVPPDMTVEEAITLAQNRRVGSLIVMEDGRVVGMVTTNDFFYRIINPILGIGKPGTRIETHEGGNPKAIAEVMGVVNKNNVGILGVHTIALPDVEKNDFCVHVDTEDPNKVNKIMEDLRRLGYQVKVRTR